MLHRLIAASMLVALCAVPASAQQGAFPDKTIRVIVPYAAGGGVDVMARLFAEKAAPLLGVPVIVENRAGASGTIGGQAVHQAAPDGSTLLFVPLTHVMANVVGVILVDITTSMDDSPTRATGVKSLTAS